MHPLVARHLIEAELCRGRTHTPTAVQHKEELSCGHDFNFGPRVIDVRDPHDEALDRSRVPQLFWYHTTTDPEWPRAFWELPENELRHLRHTAQWPEDEIERHRRFYENQALHVGTYEAAIESMLRRINEQGDRGSVFYLYRVRLRSDLRVAPNWRDENQEQAAKITRMDLAAEEWDGLRYLNAYESMGSISLALVRLALTQPSASACRFQGGSNRPAMH